MRGLEIPLRQFLAGMEFVFVDVTEDLAMRGREAYRRWGKGMHKARLNLGDCFAYALAERYGVPLLFVGDDFAQTDVLSAFDTET